MDNSTMALIQECASALKKAYYGVQYLLNNKIDPCEEVYFRVSQILNGVASKQQTAIAIVGHDFPDVFSWKPDKYPFELKEGVLTGDLKEAHNYMTSLVASDYDEFFLKSYLQCCLKEVKSKGSTNGNNTKAVEQKASTPSARSNNVVLPLFKNYANCVGG